MNRFVKIDIGIYGVETFEDIENLPFDKWVKWELMDKLNNPECKGTHYRGTIFIFPSHAESIEDLRITLWHEIAHSASYGLGLKQDFKAACLDYLDVKLPNVYDNIARSYHRSKWEEEAVAYLFEKTFERYGVEKLFSSKFVGREAISTVFREIIKYLKDGTGEYYRFRQTPLRSRSASKIHKGSGTAERNDSNDRFDGRRNSGSQEVRSSKAQRARIRESDSLFRDGNGTGEVVSDGTREAYETAITGNKFCIILINEAEKTFKDTQEVLLKMIDGVYYSSRKLYILTTNKLIIDENLLGQPGRIRYIKEFGNLSIKAVNEVIDDNLLDTCAGFQVLFFNIFHPAANEGGPWLSLKVDAGCSYSRVISLYFP